MKDKEIYLILNNVRSAHNVGSIFRTADGAGVKKIFLCGITPRPTSDNLQLTIDKISKTALGAEKFVPWEYHAQAWRALRELKVKSSKLKVIGLEQSDRSKNIFKYKLKAKSRKLEAVVLVVGNEVRGLSKKILEYCDDVVQIPMYGKKESLNVSVATGIALYALTESK